MSTPKRKTLLSREEDPSKRLQFENNSLDESLTGEMNVDPKEQHEKGKASSNKKMELEEHEDRMLEKIQDMITPIEIGMKALQSEWSEHKEEMKKLQEDNQRLNFCLQQAEKHNRDLLNRIKAMEDRQVENNIIFNGIKESTWESTEVCKEKVFGVLSNLVNHEKAEERMNIARNIPIVQVKQIGTYNPLRPICVTFSCNGDIDYILENKGRL